MRTIAASGRAILAVVNNWKALESRRLIEVTLELDFAQNERLFCRLTELGRSALAAADKPY